MDCKQSIGRGVKPLRIAHHGDRSIRVGDGRRPACAVDHVQDATKPGLGEEDREQIFETSRREGAGNFKRVFGVDVHALVEEAVATHTISVEAGHIAGNLEGRPTVDTRSLHPCRLAGRVVGHLILEEDVCAAIPVPDHLVLLVVLDEKAIRGHVVTVDDKTGIGGVTGPAHTGAMVGPPCPDVIEDDIGAVDDQAGRRAARLRAADTEEHILKSRRVGGVLVIVHGATSDLEQHRRVRCARVEDQFGDHDPRRIGDLHGHDPVLRDQRWEAETEHHGIGIRHVEALAQIIDPWSQDQVLTTR